MVTGEIHQIPIVYPICMREVKVHYLPAGRVIRLTELTNKDHQRTKAAFVKRISQQLLQFALGSSPIKRSHLPGFGHRTSYEAVSLAILPLTGLEKIG